VARTSASGSPLGSGSSPIEIVLAGDVGALVAAAHRPNHVGLFCKLAGEQLRPTVGKIDAELDEDHEITITDALDSLNAAMLIDRSGEQITPSQATKHYMQIMTI
jgi:hypothetical protein